MPIVSIRIITELKENYFTRRLTFRSVGESLSICVLMSLGIGYRLESEDNFYDKKIFFK